MGTVAPTQTGESLIGPKLSSKSEGFGCNRFTWSALNSTNASGDAVDCRGYKSLEIQINGTWNTGTLTFQGSIDGTNYVTLTKKVDGSTAISHTSTPTVLIPVYECPAYVKPVLTGAGTDSINVIMIARN